MKRATLDLIISEQLIDVPTSTTTCEEFGRAPGAVPELQESDSRGAMGVVRGRLTGFSSSAAPIIEYRVRGIELTGTGLSIVELRASDLGKEVLLAFEEGDSRQPVVTGFVFNGAPPSSTTVHVESDGERLVLSAKREIVLTCGEASITLTRAGKVILRGSYLLSRSSGVNRIKGGSVQIN